MKNVKKFILSLSALALCCVAGGGALSAVKASADGVANTVDTVKFQMASGAAIRISDNSEENGIRYQITMPDSEYKALEANSAYSSVSYGILIAPNDYAKKNALDKANVFGASAVYDWAEKNENGEWVYNDNSSKTRIMNFETDTLSPWSKDETVRTYFGSIVDLEETNIPRDFVGVGYIKYTTADGTDYVFADANDNVRSMSQVARLAYADTGADALDQTTKNEVKKTYIDDVYGKTFDFNSKADAYLAKSGENTVITPDEEVSGVTGLQGTLKNGKVNGVVEGVNYDFKIDLGGEYQFKYIKQVIVKYRVFNGKPSSNSWWRTFLNDNTTEGQQLVKGTGVTFSTEKGRASEEMTEYGTLTIDPSVANAKTGLTGDDYFYAISFGYRQSTELIADRVATMIIDSIEIVAFEESYLEFNNEESLSLVKEGHNTSIVDLGDGNKALQADLKHWESNSSPRWNINIELGGIYKVSEVEKIEIGWKRSCACSSTSWWHIAFNTNERLATGWTDRRVTSLSGGDNPTFAASGKTVISQARILATDNMDENTIISNVFIATDDSTKHTLQIDYIRITLK